MYLRNEGSYIQIISEFRVTFCSFRFYFNCNESQVFIIYIRKVLIYIYLKKLSILYIYIYNRFLQ